MEQKSRGKKDGEINVPNDFADQMGYDGKIEQMKLGSPFTINYDALRSETIILDVTMSKVGLQYDQDSLSYGFTNNSIVPISEMSVRGLDKTKVTPSDINNSLTINDS